MKHVECPDARLCRTAADLLEAYGFTGTQRLREIAGKLQDEFLAKLAADKQNREGK